MAEPQQQTPMGDASMLPQQQPDMSMQQDPSMMGADPSMGGDMNDGPMMDDPSMMGGETDMMGGGTPDKKRSEIQKNIGKACADFRTYQGQDKEDLGKWISGMLDSLDTESGDGDVVTDGDSIDSPMEQEPMPNESVNKKYQKNISETLRDIEDTDDKKRTEKIRGTKNTPFNNPNFQN